MTNEPWSFKCADESAWGVQLGHSSSNSNQPRLSKWRAVFKHPSKLYILLTLFKIFFFSLENPSASKNMGQKSCSRKAVNHWKDQTASLRSLRYFDSHIGSKPTLTSRSVLNVQRRPGWLVKHLQCLLNVELNSNRCWWIEKALVFSSPGNLKHLGNRQQPKKKGFCAESQY